LLSWEEKGYHSWITDGAYRGSQVVQSMLIPPL
jgi:hypothetical protein